MNTYEPYKRLQRRRHPERFSSLQMGSLTNPEKLAIYVVFQPTGLSNSTFETMRHLGANGYAVFLVSNAKLQHEDVSKALRHCWKIMERQNFGYDFGGYQDAIRHIWASSVHPQALVIINDSIWFPLRQDSEILQQMEATPSPFTGAFQLDPSRKKNPIKKKRPFMGSFFWHFKAAALRDPAFRSFWNNYKATSSKHATIRRGERRFTHHMLDGGVRCEAIYSRQMFDDWICKLESTELHHALKDLCTPDRKLQLAQHDLINSDVLTQDWKDRALNLARKITQSQNIMATAPIFMVRNQRLPFFKKTIDANNALALNRLLELARQEPKAIENLPVLNEILEKTSQN